MIVNCQIFAFRKPSLLHTRWASPIFVIKIVCAQVLYYFLLETIRRVSRISRAFYYVFQRTRTWLSDVFWAVQHVFSNTVGSVALSDSGVLYRGAATPGPAVLVVPQLVGLENFYVLYVTETCKKMAGSCVRRASSNRHIFELRLNNSLR